MHLFSSKLDSFIVQYPNQEEFRNLKKELFTQDCYYFESTEYAPRIIDAGAHIGMATLYFKKLYPFSHITAIEANPDTAEMLRTNVEYNHCRDVTIVTAALAATTDASKLFVDSSEDSFNSTASFSPRAWTGNQIDQKRTLEVPSVLLADFLHEPVDFLKMDIEGAEQLVLTAAKDKLHMISHLIVEFHPTPQQSLTSLLALLHATGFSTTIWKDGSAVENTAFLKGLVLVEATR